MTAPGSRDIDIIATRILFESKDAIADLARFDKSVDKTAQRIQKLTDITRKVAAGLGNDFSKAEAAMRRIASIKMPTGELGKGGKPIMQPLINPNELKQAFLIARGSSKEIGDFYGRLGVEQGKVAAAGAKTSAQLLAQENKLIAAREKENALIDQAGQKLSNQLLAQQRVADAMAGSKIQNFVKQNFGDINAHIANSTDKVAAWRNVVQQSARATGVSFEQAGAELRKMVSGTTVAPLNTALKQLGNDGRSAFQKLVDGAHFARIALGALVSMFLFQGIQAVTTFFTTAIKEARDFEATLYRISNVERVLSLEGIDITVQGLKKGIHDIQDALPIFAKEDIAQLVGAVATTTKELGYTEEEILKLSAAIGILNVNSTSTETLLQTQARVTNSLISPQAKSIGDLGLSFGQAKIEAKAFEMQILETGESFKDLTEKEKQQIKLQIVFDTAQISDTPVAELREEIERAGGDLQALNNYLESNDAKLYENAAAWSDLKVAIGQTILPFIPLLTDFFQFLTDGINGGKVLLIEFGAIVNTLGQIWASIWSGNAMTFKEFISAFETGIEEFRAFYTGQFFKEVPDNAPDWFTKNYAPLIEESADTATAAIDEMTAAAEDTEEAQKALDDLDQKIEDIIVDAKHAKEDLDLKLEQKQDDLDTEYNRKAEDAARDHADKLADIDTDARQKAEDAKRKAREDEKKAERDLLQKLKELRERFLLDLEDALRERDARQVLRLIKEYKLEKQNILDRKKLDDQERKERLAEELRTIEIERQRKIEQEQIDYQRKLADLALQKQREQEELALWYAREQEDIQRNIDQKLEKLIAGYIAEGQLTEEHQAAITAILAKHFGNNMALVDQMVAYMQSRFAQMASMSLQTPVIYPNPQGTKGAAGVGSGRRYAEGGSVIADRPTTATFGERGLEMATFTPLGRNGKDVSKVFGDLGGAMGGNLQLGIMLSPDLRAEIINTTMDKVALNIEHTRRERR